MLLVIENLEPKLSEWLLIEYSHSAKTAGKNLLITNLSKAAELRKLAKVAKVEKKRAQDIFAHDEIVLLDPLAKKVLSPPDLEGKRAILIGGILGNDPPIGRTKELLTKNFPRATVRNIGRAQFSIDGAVFVAKQISLGRTLTEIPVQIGLELQVAKGYSVNLPYAFPLVRGKPFISSKLAKYLSTH